MPDTYIFRSFHLLVPYPDRIKKIHALLKKGRKTPRLMTGLPIGCFFLSSAIGKNMIKEKP
jgi:hypothetical protein